MNQLLLVLITALVTSVVSISGIWFGSRLTRVAEDRKWRRDRVVEAYAEFLSAVDVAIAVAGNAYGARYGSDEHAEQCRLVLEKVAEMHRLSGRIILLSSDAVEAPFSSLSGFITTNLLIMAIKCPKASPEERKATNTKLASLLAAFMVVARDDIGIHPAVGGAEITKKPWWKLWA